MKNCKMTNRITERWKSVDWGRCSEGALMTMFFLVAMIIVSTILKLSILASLLFYGTFIVLAFAVFAQYMDKGRLPLTYWVAIAIALTGLFDICVTGAWLDFSHYKKWTFFVTTVAFLVLIDGIKTNKIIVDFILISNILVGCFCILAYAISSSIRTSRYMTLNFTNPNLAGMFLLYILLYCFLSFWYYKGRIKRILIGCLCGGLLYLMIRTQCRGAMLSLCFFIALAGLAFASQKIIKIERSLSIIALLTPLIFVWIYILFNEFNLFRFLSFAEISEGKPVDTRMTVWGPAMELLSKHWFTGHFSVANAQLHNIYLDVWCSYGFLALVGFIFLLFEIIERILHKHRPWFQRLALIAFFSMLTMGCFEAAFVSGGLGIYVLCAGFLILAKYPSEQLPLVSEQSLSKIRLLKAWDQDVAV